MPKTLSTKKAKNAAPAPTADLTARIEKVLSAARREGREEALAEVRSLVSGGAAVADASPAAAAPTKRGPGRPRKSAPADAAPAKAARKQSSEPRKNPWATMTPEQKADRVRKMLAGRGIKPKS